MNPTDDPSEPLGVEPDALPQARWLDVRRAPAFGKSPVMLPDAVWRDPALVDSWSGELDPTHDVVVYCVYGHEVSRNTALRLRALGVRAWFLRGGIDAWAAAGRPVVGKPVLPD